MTVVSAENQNATGTQNQNTTQQNASTGATTGTQANTYNAGQQALQNQLSQLLPGYIQGGTIPTAFTAPPAAFQNLNNQLTNQVNPAIAAQYGAGSPQIGAQDALAQTNLAAQLYQAGVQNYTGALGLAGNLAYNPIGQNTTGTSNGTGTGSSTLTNDTTQNQNNLGIAETSYGSNLLSTLKP